MDGFVRMNGGTISPEEFLSPEDVGAIEFSKGRKLTAGSMSATVLPRVRQNDRE
jgi:hypothetical protein